jgi:hypothetical protein
MHIFNHETLVRVLSEREGVDVASYGKPRDAFILPISVPFWTSGYGGRYEMRHTNVPAGAWVAVGNLEDLDLSDFGKLKEQLCYIDIYPTGHSGDFTGKTLTELDSWFSSRSRRDDNVNSQTPIIHTKRLTSAGLDTEKYEELVGYLADNMSLFKNTDNDGALVPDNTSERQKIVRGILYGLSQTVRYTRLDEPAKAYQFFAEMIVYKQDKGAISLTLTEESKILIMRRYKNGEVDITPLDRSMLGRTYATKDGQPLGNRGMVELSDLLKRGLEIESEKNQSRSTLPPELAAMLLSRDEFFGTASRPEASDARSNPSAGNEGPKN